MRHRDGAKFEKSFKIENFNFFSFLRHEVPFKAKNNREAVVVCAIHVVKRPSKRSVLVLINMGFTTNKHDCFKLSLQLHLRLKQSEIVNVN